MFRSFGTTPSSWPRSDAAIHVLFPQRRRGCPARRPGMTLRKCFNTTGTGSGAVPHAPAQERCDEGIAAQIRCIPAYSPTAFDADTRNHLAPGSAEHLKGIL